MESDGAVRSGFQGECGPLSVMGEGGGYETGSGVILKLYIYIYKDIFLHLFFALCALKALDKLFGFAFLSSAKLEAPPHPCPQVISPCGLSV